jgi:hypothetical protein
MTKESLLPLPAKQTPTLVKFLSDMELQTLGGITPNEYLHLWDLALGYEFWVEKQECLKKLTHDQGNTQP